VFFFSSRGRHTRSDRDWSSDVCSSDLGRLAHAARGLPRQARGGGELEAAGGSGRRVSDTAPGPAISKRNGITIEVDRELCFGFRSEERRVGKESTCRCAPDTQKIMLDP